MANKIIYTIIICYDFAKEWLDKNRDQRKQFEKEHVTPILMKYAGKIKPRAYDAEAFTADFSDFMIIETGDLSSYYFMIEELRSSPLFTSGLASISKIFMGIEDGYHTFEKDFAKGEAHAVATA